jgi:hypothetical protein
MKANPCQVIIWISFEWSRKTLKCRGLNDGSKLRTCGLQL